MGCNCAKRAGMRQAAGPGGGTARVAWYWAAGVFNPMCVLTDVDGGCRWFATAASASVAAQAAAVPAGGVPRMVTVADPQSVTIEQ